MLDIEWSPSPAVVASDFYASAEALENLEVPLTASIPAVIGGIQQIFDSEGPGWAAWSESYAPYAQAHNVGILDQTGDLKESTGDPGDYAVIGDVLGFTGATSPAYWIFHQEGTSKMPARPFVSLTPESEMEVISIFEEWLASVISVESTSAGRVIFRAPSGRFVAPI